MQLFTETQFPAHGEPVEPPVISRPDRHNGNMAGAALRRAQDEREAGTNTKGVPIKRDAFSVLDFVLGLLAGLRHPEWSEGSARFGTGRFFVGLRHSPE